MLIMCINSHNFGINNTKSYAFLFKDGYDCPLLWRAPKNKAAYVEKNYSIVWNIYPCHCHVIPAHLTIRQCIKCRGAIFCARPSMPPARLYPAIRQRIKCAGAKYCAPTRG